MTHDGARQPDDLRVLRTYSRLLRHKLDEAAATLTCIVNKRRGVYWDGEAGERQGWSTCLIAGRPEVASTLRME